MKNQLVLLENCDCGVRICYAVRQVSDGEPEILELGEEGFIGLRGWPSGFGDDLTEAEIFQQENPGLEWKPVPPYASFRDSGRDVTERQRKEVPALLDALKIRG